MDEIGRFCNPTTARSTAIVCNSLLRTVMLELLENAKARAFDEGKKEGYYEGYEEGRYLASEDEQNNVFETLRKEDEEKARNATFEEGRTHGRLEERASWVSNHGEGLCASPEVSMPRTRASIDASVQATPRTDETAAQTYNAPERRCAALQTEPPDDEHLYSLKNAETTLCIDFNMQTTTETTEATTQTENDPAALVTSLPFTANATTSSLTTPAQPPSTTPTTSTTTTTTLSSAPKPLLAPQKRRHTLPSRPTAPPFEPRAPPFRRHVTTNNVDKRRYNHSRNGV
jgi:hypothetical protein